MKQLQIPIFDINIDDEALGLFGLSFVDNPATQVELHYFKEEKPLVYFSSHEKREVVAPVIIPNQLIYRQFDGMGYYMRASAETIKKMYERYMLSGDWNNFTYMHQDLDKDMSERALDGIYLQRLWIIEDEKNDDAFTKYGFKNLPAGTMMMKCKVNNRQILKELREGNLRGISLEALFNKTNSNKALQISYSKMKDTLNLFQKFVAFLNEVSSEAENIATEAKKDETNSGDLSLKYYIDDEHFFEVDEEGFVRDENGLKVEEGEYKLADGNVFVVDNNNKFVETKTIDEAKQDETIEAPIAEGFKKEEKEDEKEVEKTDGEDAGETDETPAETDVKDDDSVDEDSADEDKEEKLDVPEVNAIPYSINGVEYLLPVEVINYIESLVTSKVEVEEKLTKLADETPSTQPIGTVVKTSNIEDNINDRIANLSMFKGFGKKY